MLLEQTRICAGLVLPALDGTKQTEYVEALQDMIPLLQAASSEEIDSLPFAENVLASFRTDRVLMKEAVKEEKDRVSMLSTLITYIACKQEGMPEHSREYMDRVTALRHKIDAYYGEKTQQFCGS